MAIVYNKLAPTDGLVLSLDSANGRSYPGTGTLWRDLSGNGGDGTLLNGVTYNGQAMSFDGTNDRITTVCPGIISTNRSASLWFRTNRTYATSNYGILLTWGAGSNYPADIGKSFQIVIGTDQNLGTNGIGVSQYGDAVGVAGFNDNKWHLIYCEAKGSVYSVFIDGIFRTSKTMTTNATTDPVIIGSTSSSTAFFQGQIDDIKVYNRALTNQEILTLYNVSRRRFL